VVEDREERRSYPRVDCVLVAMVARPGAEPVRGRVVNLSLSGICVRVDQEIEAGVEAMFHMRLVRSWSETGFLSVPAKIVRSVEVAGAFEVGGQFHESLDEHTKTLLDTLVRMLAGQLGLGDA
jgi:c-di-GMP-binding flagellar brake protein YcgR